MQQSNAEPVVRFRKRGGQFREYDLLLSTKNRKESEKEEIERKKVNNARDDKGREFMERMLAGRKQEKEEGEE